MPRPSDVYATFGAPGVYQATPSTPSRLPNVYLFPPEEDNQDKYCLFYSGSASPTTFESFYNHPVYTQRDPNSPTLTDLKALDHALSYLQRHSATNNNTRYGPEGSWEHEERIQTTSCNFYPHSTTSSPSSQSSLSESLKGSSEIEAETSIYPNARYPGKAEGQCEEGQYHPNPPSRRSSVFGDRPPDYEIRESHVLEENLPAARKSQTMTFRSRAAMALKSFGTAVTRRMESQAPVIPEFDDGSATHEGWLESNSLRRKRSRQEPLHSHIDIPTLTADVHLEVAPTHPSSSVRDPKLVVRKPMTQLFGLGRNFIENRTGANTAYPRPDLGHPAMRSSSSLTSPVGEVKLSKRRSMAQVLGMRRGASSTELSDHTIVAVDADETCSDISEAPGVASPRSQEGPYPCSATSGPHITGAVKGSQSLVSLVTSGPTVPTGGGRSFLRRRGISFLDLHRHFSTDHGSRTSPQAEHPAPLAPRIEPSGSFSPDSLSEGTDSSSSVAASTECEQTIEDDMHFPVPDISTVMRQDSVADAKDFEPNLLSRSQLDLDNTDVENIPFSPQFRLEVPDDDVESGTGEDLLTLEFAVRLDSPTFDQLVFDPESFTGSVYD